VTRDAILTLSLLLSAALVARLVASLLRVPAAGERRLVAGPRAAEILMLVLFGALLGPSVLEVIDVPFDSIGAQLMFTLGVSLILFYGGLNLSVDVLRRVWVGLGMLVVPGVLLTAVITGAVAYLAFDLSWTAALLMGAVLAPTDPAILIPLFVRSRLRPKVAQTVVAESAFNDPTGAVLALALAGVLLSGDASLATPVSEFAVDLGISTALGLVAGVLLAAAISSRRAGIWRESSPLAVLAVVTIGYFSLDYAGGSGYLGAFLAGLIVGNMDRLGLAMHSAHEREMRRFAFNLADLVTLFVFMVLGANIPFDELGANFLPALAVLAALLLLARPLTVLVCTLPDRWGSWTRPELAFLCWTRETGVVPAALVGVLAGLGVPNNGVYASVVALAIIMTLVLQALPAAWLAGRLGLLDGEAPAPPSPAPGTVG
jgi:cell volume regulation protein A